MHSNCEGDSRIRVRIGAVGQGEKVRVLEEYFHLKIRIHTQRGGDWKVLREDWQKKDDK